MHLKSSIRSSLSEAIAVKHHCTRQQALRMVNAFFKAIISVTNEGESVELNGFGRFEKRHYKSHIGRDFTSGKDRIVPEHDKLVFVASSSLKKFRLRLYNGVN